MAETVLIVEDDQDIVELLSLYPLEMGKMLSSNFGSTLPISRLSTS